MAALWGRHPLGFSVGWPSCHLSNDFFILQEKLVARGNAPLPAQGNPTLVQADARTHYVCSQITRDQHILSSCLFLCFLFPLYPHNHQYNPFFFSSHFSSGGLALPLSSNSLLLTYKPLFSIPLGNSSCETLKHFHSLLLLMSHQSVPEWQQGIFILYYLRSHST